MSEMIYIEEEEDIMDILDRLEKLSKEFEKKTLILSENIKKLIEEG